MKKALTEPKNAKSIPTKKEAIAPSFDRQCILMDSTDSTTVMTISTAIISRVSMEVDKGEDNKGFGRNVR